MVVKEYLQREWRYNVASKYLKYFEEWFKNLTENQLLYFTAWANNKKNPYDKH